MAELIPAIIPDTFTDISEHTDRVVGLVSRVQVDVMDGQYAPEASWPYNGREEEAFAELVSGKRCLPHAEALEYEIDMMVSDPESRIDAWIDAGAQALIVHAESTEVLDAILPRIKARGVLVGIALKPSTPNATIAPFVPEADFIQCMGSDKIGYHGVALEMEAVVGKVKDLRMTFPDAIISVDIGVNAETAPKLVAAGVTKLVSGSAVFGSENIAETIRSFQAL